MSISPAVSPSMVEIFKISPTCLESRPCKHVCTITLSDGREKSVTLNRLDINLLMQVIANEKISYSKEMSHFICSSFENRSAESTLTDFFK